MKKLTLQGINKVSEEEQAFIQNRLDEHSKDLHYLAFARQIFGFNPLGTWLKDNKELEGKNDEIITALCEKKEVCSLYPVENLTLYPIIKAEDGNFYNVDFANNDKNFKDVLELNDKHYKAKYMVVDFGHTANNLQDNYDLVIESLKNLLSKSTKLESIYIIE